MRGVRKVLNLTKRESGLHVFYNIKTRHTLNSIFFILSALFLKRAYFGEGVGENQVKTDLPPPKRLRP